MKKILSLILAVLMMTGTCAAVTATAYAASASYKIIRVTPSKSNAAADIQKALD
ncbi:MAG: hypothetical protein LUG95_04150 [Clostridiales bacterium]|nr:hypothetical protein [Clostridiales bacterium]